MKSIHEFDRTPRYYYRLARHKLHMAWRQYRLATNYYDSGLGDSAWLLYGLVRAMKPQVCVEIGSARGKSTCHIAQALRENLGGMLYAIDPHRPTSWNDAGETNTLHALRRNLRAMGGDAYVEVIQSYSTDAARGWNRPIDMVFIDGDHSYDGVKSDWELFSPHVSRFGVVVFHDTTWKISDKDFVVREDLGVTRLLEELRADGYPLITIDRNYGVTLVQPTRGGVPLERMKNPS